MPPLRIFISYGRDQYAPLAARLAADLKARGYEVWFDQQLQSGRSWAGDIQERLDWLAEVPQYGRFVYLLSQHSTRRTSFCLSELQYAIDNYVAVFPVLVEKCKIPLEIYPLHRLDFRACLPVEENQAAYARLVETLAADMEGEVEPRLAQQRIIEEQTPSGPPAPGPTPAVEVRSVKPIAPPVLPPAPVEEVNPSEAPPPQSLPQPPAPEGEIHLERLPVELAVPVSPPPQLPADLSRWLEFLRGALQRRSGRIILFALFVVLVVAALVLLLPGSLPVVFSPATPTPTVTPTATPTSTLTSTLTLTPSVTVTPTRTATPTLTPSPTSTLMPPNCTGIGQTWKSPIDGMILVCVPAGEFLMGSTDADKDSQTFEKPQHTVHLDAFWIDQTEVTNAMFTKFISASGYRTNAEKAGQSYVYANNQFSQVKGADWQHPSGPGSNLGGKETFPAIHVNWNDAKAYCEWAGRQLPSEAQWEKAARGADGRLYPWGNQAPDNSYLNYKNFKGDTTAVKSYEQGKSPYDAYDMAGNVWEWVADWYDEKYYSSQSTWRNPGGPGSSPQGARVNRGGSWINSSGNVRAADRLGNVPANTSDFIGFRCFR